VLYVSDPVNRRVRTIDLLTGLVRTIAGGGQNRRDGLASSADLISPAGLAVLPDGDLVVADYVAHAVRRVGTGR
jgi:hypothetical protein